MAKNHSKTCLNCNKRFIAKNIRAAFCSDRCRVSANRKKSVTVTEKVPIEQSIAEIELEKTKILLQNEEQTLLHLQNLAANYKKVKDAKELKDIVLIKEKLELQNQRAKIQYELSIKNKSSYASKVLEIGQTTHEKLLGFFGGIILDNLFEGDSSRQDYSGMIKSIDAKIGKINTELNRVLFNPLVFSDIKVNEAAVEKLKQKCLALEEEIIRSNSIKELAQIKDKDGFVKAKDVQSINFAGRVQFSGALGDFIGLLEMDKCAITLTGKPGSGKTYLCFDLISKFIELDFSVAYFSIEEGITNLTLQKIEKYKLQASEKFKINDQATLQDIQKFASSFDVIVIDSWGKLNADIAEFDKLRIAFPKTIFISIFQLTSSGQMRGGTMAAFDAGVNIETSIIENKRFAICSKNRYGNTGIKYWIDERVIAI
ncbi:MAG: hypothetical protein IPP32_02980 [Bacteroidetes bacterium]|nr:hypothetical protein [Bacteroidota bacterium]